MTVPHRASRHTPGRALLLVALGVTLAGVAVVAACQSAPPADFGAPPVSTQASPSVTAPESAGVPISDGRSLTGRPQDPPARLRVPALKLDAAVDAVGIDTQTGDFAVPPSVDTVGWYRFGPGFSAEAGSIVIAGHVDSADQGDGAFFRLGSLEKGDTMTLTGPGGRTRTFEVLARERYRKTAIPLDRYFARDGATRLTLITCGGPFDTRTGHYRDNVVVTAAPVRP